MATKLYPRQQTPYPTTGWAQVIFANGVSGTMGGAPYSLAATPGASLQTFTINCINGPITAVENSGAFPTPWISPPVAADVTISGAISCSIWCSESSMAANAGINFVVYVVRATDGSVVEIARTNNATEMATTTRAAQTPSVTPGAAVTVNKGDRLLARIFVKDAGGTLTSGNTVSVSLNGATAAADGDTWIQFTETFSFLSDSSDPAGTKLYPTSTASDATTGTTTKREMWTSRGSTDLADVTATAAGPFTPSNAPQVTNENTKIQQTGTNTSFTLGQVGNVLGAMSFKRTDADGYLASVTLKLSKVGAPTDNLIVQLQPDGAGSPLGTVLATIGLATAASLTGTQTDRTFTLGAPIFLTQNTTYWIVVSRSGGSDNSNYFQVGGISSDFYGDGVWLKNDGTNWVTMAGILDAYFILTYGNPVEWYTRKLQAFTLGGMARLVVWALESNISGNAAIRAEIARVDSDGSNPTVWATWQQDPNDSPSTIGELDTTLAAYDIWMSGADLSVSANQRLRLRLFLDDFFGGSLTAGFTVTTRYNGPTASASGDTYLILPQTVVESVPTTPKSGTDANGTTTESAAVNVVITATEAGTAVETLGNRVLVASDTGGTTKSFGVSQHEGASFPIGDGTSRTKVGQSFSYGADFALNDLQVWCTKQNSPSDSVVFSICADNAGQPGTVLGSYTILASSFPASPAWFQIAGGTIAGLNLTANTTYWLTAERTGALDGSNYVQLVLSFAAGYSGINVQYDGAAWNQIGGQDMSFLVTLNSEVGTRSPLFKSSSDSNGATTETAALSVSTTTPDANGATTESTSIVSITPVSATDANGLTTETVNKVSVAADANGVTAEDVGKASVAVDANGVMTDTPVLAAKVGANAAVDSNTGFGYIDIGYKDHSVGPVAVGNVAANTKVAQSFVLDAPVTIGDWSLWLQRVGTPADNVVYDIQTDNAGQPSGVSLGSRTRLISGVSNQAGGFWESIYGGTLTSAIKLQANTVYWIVLSRTGALDAANYIQWYSGSTPYTVGAPMRWNGSAWSGDTNDLAFYINTDSQEVATPLVPKSDTDANGVVTESGSANFATVVTDTDGANPEVVTLASAIPVTDVNAATTETANAVPQVTLISGTDANGATTEAVTLLANPISTDATGTTTEATSLTQVNAITATDTNGATTEAISAFAKVTTDVNGTVTEFGTTSTINQVSDTDNNGTTTESAAFTYTAVAPDMNGSTTESAVAQVVMSATDTGTDTEIVSALAKVAADLNGAVTETANTNVPVPATDAGAGTDVETPKAVLPTTDANGSTTESVTYKYPFSVTDNNGVTTEAGSVTSVNAVSSTDTGTIIEVTAQTANLTTTDANSSVGEVGGTGTIKSDVDANFVTTESVAMARQVADASGTATESAALRIGVTDSATSTESASNVFLASGGADTGIGSDVASPRFLVARTDANGTSTEQAALLAAYLVADAGSATDTGSVFAHPVVLVVQDFGFGTDEGIVGGLPIEVGIPVDMTHAILSVNGNGTPNVVVRTSLGKATLTKVG